MNRLLSSLLLLGILLLCSACNQILGEPDEWGNRTHEEALTFVENQCNLHVHEINERLKKSGNLSVNSAIQEQQQEQMNQAVGQSGEAPPKPSLKTEELVELLKHWAKKVPEDDDLLKKAYAELRVAVVTLGKLYDLTDSPDEFNRQVDKATGKLNGMYGLKKQLRKRDGGFEP